MTTTSKIIIHTEGVKGNGIKDRGNQGYVNVYTEDAEIAFDAFEGEGENYKRREKTLITVTDKGSTGNIIFNGTFADLAKLLNHHKKYGMTLKEIRDEIADFTGDKKGEAMRKAKIFAHNISISNVCQIRLSYGSRDQGDGKKLEDPKWLVFRWTDTDGDSDTFSIIE